MRSVILTRPRHQAEEFATLIRQRFDAEVHCCPLIEIEYHPSDWPSDIGGVILTSANAVRSVAPRPGMTALCVGDATADAARNAGFDALSADGTADHLARMMLGDPALMQIAWFYPHGAHVVGSLVADLTNAGVKVQSTVSYKQVERAWSEAERETALRGDNLFPVFSPNAARVLSVALKGVSLPKARFLAISAQAAERLVEDWVGQIAVAAHPSREAMLDLIGEEQEQP